VDGKIKDGDKIQWSETVNDEELTTFKDGDENMVSWSYLEIITEQLPKPPSPSSSRC
jgi:hypothetical protein